MEITVVVLQARAKLSDNKINGPGDAIVSEMFKKLPLETICTIACRFSLLESPSFVEDRETGLLEEIGRYFEAANNSADIGDVEVACILYYSAPGQRKRAPSGRIFMTVEWMG